MIQHVWLVVRRKRDSYYEWGEEVIAAHLDEEQAKAHHAAAQEEIRRAEKRCRRWALGRSRARDAWRSPYDAGLRADELYQNHNCAWAVYYELKQVPLVAGVDQYQERFPV